MVEHNNPTDLLEENLTKKLEELSSAKCGAPDFNATLECVETLYRLKIDEEKNRAEIELKYHELNQNHADNVIDTEDKNKQQKFDIGLKVVGAVASALFYTGLYLCGMAYEQHGSITTKAVGGVIRQMPSIFKKQK